MSAAGNVLAVAACLIGGLCNSTWPLVSKYNAPKAFRITSPGGWECFIDDQIGAVAYNWARSSPSMQWGPTWENVWLIFTVMHCVFNAIYCIGAVGPAKLHTVYSQASAQNIGLVCMFSFLWGGGTVCFSLGIKMLGAALGTALLMSLLIVLGALLPLIRDYSSEAGSAAALVTIAGLLLAVLGFLCSAYSSKLRDKVEVGAGMGRSISKNLGAATVQESGAMTHIPSPDAADCALEKGGMPAPSYSPKTAQASEARSPSGVGKLEPAGLVVEVHGGSSVTVGIMICLVGAILASMLQAAFIFGQPLTNYAEDQLGMSSELAPPVVWLLAFSLAGISNLAYAIYLLTVNETWGRYNLYGVGENLRKVLWIAFMSIIFPLHIHLYGVAQALIGNLGTVIAWPLLMSSTVLMGQMWSIVLKEWEGAPPRAMHVNVVSIGLLICAVTIIALAGSVL